MKTTDRAVVIGFLSVALLAGFYMMVLSPKREEAATLGEEVTQLESEISQQEQTAAFAEQARQEFPKYYGRMVNLGKAVPEGADTASLLVQLNSVATDADVEFQTLQLAQGGETAAPPPTTPPPTDAGGEAAPASTPTGEAPAATGVAAPATETAAATLPVGATVGTAGLPTLPYDLGFTGNFFEIADFVDGLDEMIQLKGGSGQVSVDGRLMTIDGFSLIGGASGSSPVLEASFVLTTYVTPAEQGLTLGATPEGPAAVPGQPSLTQTSSVSP